MDPLRLVSVVGALAMIAIGIAIGRDRRAIRWRTVAWGIGLQWAAAVVLLRIPAGRAALETAARGVQTVLDQSYKGSQFVFGQLGMPQGGDTGVVRSTLLRAHPLLHDGAIRASELQSVLPNASLYIYDQPAVLWTNRTDLRTRISEFLNN